MEHWEEMEKRNFLLQPVFYVAMIIYFVLGFSALTFGAPLASLVFSEDRYFENVGALALFAASALSFVAFLRARKTRAVTRMSWIKQLVYLGFAVLFFFGAGEEISWGQRILGIETPPALQEENVQGEINVHNLLIFENMQFFTAERLFDILWTVFAVAIPVASLLTERFRRFALPYVPIVFWGIGSLFVINYLFAQAAQFFFRAAYTYETIPFRQAVQEVKESNYEVLFAFLALYLLRDLNKLIQDSSKDR
jgi:hypothetical protein